MSFRSSLTAMKTSVAFHLNLTSTLKLNDYDFSTVLNYCLGALIEWAVERLTSWHFIESRVLPDMSLP